MALLKFRKSQRNGGVPRKEEKERKGRRAGGVRRHIRDLYQTDLDRYLWSWTGPTNPRKKKAQRKRRRRIARLVASAAGMVGAAGASYLLYRRLRRDHGQPEDPVAAQADLDEDLDEG